MKLIRHIKLNDKSICEEWNKEELLKLLYDLEVSLLRRRGPSVTYLEADDDHNDR
jgi:hypothetical protein